ncbi:hypothetical protein WJX72_011033 [[Myrmecia] bisecta]|uniref:Tetratricopeptide repeat protein n=1 Tax=[Myrmecia] bisecta TaxID=41462 RepID=A0AAW1Q354_9CHLO
MPAAGQDNRRLQQAAKDFEQGLSEGLDEDDIVALQLGKQSAEELSDIQERYKERIKQKLAEQAEEQRRAKERKNLKFTQGKLAYERGRYPESVYAFERALDDEGPFSQLGGEIQLWLALAYQAVGREEDCISLYKVLEKTHPVRAIQKQAADLRYIMEAPKLPLRPDEKVNIPVLTGVDRYVPQRTPIARSRPMPQASRVKKSMEEEFWENYRPPQWVSNRYVWVAATILAVGLAGYSAYVANL